MSILSMPHVLRAISGRQRSYAQRVLATGPIAYWPLWDSGAQAQELVAGNHGVHVNVASGQPGIGDRQACGGYDGATAYTNIYSAALAAAFSPAEGTLLCWAKVANAGVWSDGAVRRVAYLQANASNAIAIYRNTVNGDVGIGRNAGGWKTINAQGLSHLGWIAWVVTWSTGADTLVGYLNGASIGQASGLGAWAGSLASTTTCIGATNTTVSHPWHGSLAHCALWNRALSPAEVAALSRI